MHKSFEHQAQRVDQQMTFASFELLATIVAAGSARMGRLDGLTIENRRRGQRLTSGRHPDALAQTAVDLLPDARPTPLPEVIIDGLPFRQIMRQHTPGAATAQYIQHGIDNGTHILTTRSASG